MKILIFWDIFWRIWRKAFKKELPALKRKYNPDFIVVNVENISSGRWPIEKLVLEMKDLWVDVMTGGDHIYDNEKNITPYLEKENSRLIRPANFYESSFHKLTWKWYKIVERDWKKLLVIHLIGEVFMRYNVDNPFLKIDSILKEFLGEKFDAIILDFHKEASAEIDAMGFFLDKKISFVYWTHTHIQTNDEIILPWWTWKMWDVWMTGSLYSVIWADYNSVSKRFLTWIWKGKIEQNLWNDYVVNWVFIEVKNKKCTNIEKIRIRNKL